MRKGVQAAALAATLLLAACGEPGIDVDIPDRTDGAHVLDLAEILSPDAADTVALAEDIDGLDVVVLTYETEQASCGEAYRAGRELVAEWDADVAIVAVAQPGDFQATDEERERCVGLQPRNDETVDGDLREEIAEVVVPPLAATNDWDAVVTAAVEALSGEG